MLEEYAYLQAKQQAIRAAATRKKLIHDLIVSLIGGAFNFFSFVYTLASDDPMSIAPKMTQAINIDSYLVSLVRSLSEMQDSMASYMKCVDLLNKIDSSDCEKTRKLQLNEEEKTPLKDAQFKLKGAIEFKNFSASYTPERSALHDINLYIPQGEKVCIVGRTGSGKSTLLLAILDLLHYTKGVRDSNKSSLNVTPPPLLVNLLRWRAREWLESSP